MVTRRQSAGTQQRHSESLVADAWSVLISSEIGRKIVDAQAIPASSDGDVAHVRQFVEDHTKRTSVRSKYRKNKHSTDLVSLHNDVRFATAVLLLDHSIGSDDYVELDTAFRAWTDLIWRETRRLGLAAEVNLTGKGAVKPDDDEDPFESEVVPNYDSIYSETEVNGPHAYFLMTQHGPVFSTPSGRSVLDYRESETHGPIALSSLQPYYQSQSPSSLGYVSPALMRIPHPAVPPTEMLIYFQHPVLRPVSAARWLKFDDETFAPTVDGAGSVFGSQDVGSVWYEKLGTKQLATEEDVRQSALESIRGEANLSDDEDVDMAEVKADGGQAQEGAAQNGANEKKEESDGPDSTGTKEVTKTEDEAGSEAEADDETDKKVPVDPHKLIQDLKLPEDAPIDPVKVLEWAPSSFVDEDELAAAKDHTELELISTLLLKLQSIQRARLSHNNGTTEQTPSDKETRLALKIQNLLARVTDDYGPKALGFELATDIPTHQVSYSGVLPAPELKTSQARLATLSKSAKNARRPR